MDMDWLCALFKQMAENKTKTKTSNVQKCASKIPWNPSQLREVSLCKELAKKKHAGVSLCKTGFPLTWWQYN
jgi:hypothetical protein